MKNRTSLLGAALAAFIGIIISVAAYTLFDTNIKEATAQTLEKQQKQLTAVAGAEIERYFYDILRRMETIALMPDVRNAQRSEACNQRLQEIVEINNQEINNLGRVSKEGEFICAVNRTVIGEPIAKYGDYFQKIANHPQHQAAMSRLIFPTGSASPVVAVHVPVYDSNGAFNGTIGGAVYFEELQERILAGTKLTKNSIIALYDNNLDVLANPDPLLRSKNLTNSEVAQLYTPAQSLEQLKAVIQKSPSEGSINYELRNAPRHATYKSAKVIDRHWTVLIAIPKSDSDELIDHNNTARSIFIGMSGLTIVLLAMLGYCLARIGIPGNGKKKDHA